MGVGEITSEGGSGVKLEKFCHSTEDSPQFQILAVHEHVQCMKLKL